MSQFKIGGFFDSNSLEYKFHAANSQSDAMGILIPQILYIGNTPSKQTVAADAEKFKDDYDNEYIYKNMFTGNSLIRDAKVDLGDDELVNFNNSKTSIVDSLKDLKLSLNSYVDYSEFIKIKISESRTANLSINVGNIFSSNLLGIDGVDSVITTPRYEDESLPDFNVVPSFDIVTFYQDATTSFVLMLNNVNMVLKQRFRARGPSNQRSKVSAEIKSLETNFYIDTGDSISGKLFYNVRYALTGLDVQDNNINLSSNSISYFNENNILPRHALPPSSESNLSTIIKYINEQDDDDYRNKKLFTKNLPDSTYFNFFNGGVPTQINETYFIPSTNFLSNYINLIFNTILIDAYNMFDPEQVKGFKLVIIDFLVCLIYNKIIYNKEFDSGKIKPNAFIIQKIMQSASQKDILEPLNLNGELYNKLKDDRLNEYFTIKNYRDPSGSFRGNFLDIKSQRIRQRIPLQLIDIYIKIIEKESILQMLQLIYENATYAKKIPRALVEKRENDYIIDCRREILSGINSL